MTSSQEGDGKEHNAFAGKSLEFVGGIAIFVGLIFWTEKQSRIS